MSTIVNKILLGFLLFLLTIAMNTIFRPTTINKIEHRTVQTTTVEKYTPKVVSHSNFTNNQKAAFFFAFPLGGMIWITSYSLYRNRKKIKALTKLEREPRVVF